MPSLVEVIAEKRIAEAAAAGAFDDLPGQGRPLPLEDDSAVPPEWRLAYRLLRRAGFAPAWIEIGHDLRRRADRVRAALASIDRSDPGWREAESRFARQALDLNREIARHNLIVPAARWQIPPLAIEPNR